MEGGSTPNISFMCSYHMVRLASFTFPNHQEMTTRSPITNTARLLDVMDKALHSSWVQQRRLLARGRKELVPVGAHTFLFFLIIFPIFLFAKAGPHPKVGGGTRCWKGCGSRFA